MYSGDNIYMYLHVHITMTCTVHEYFLFPHSSHTVSSTIVILHNSIQ